MLTFSQIAVWISGIFAGLSALALPLWLLGVPGVDGAYARGWKIGLYALLLYPVGWVGLFLGWRFERAHAAVSGADAAGAIWFAIGQLVFLAIAAAGLGRAFRAMSRAEPRQAAKPAAPR